MIPRPTPPVVGRAVHRDAQPDYGYLPREDALAMLLRHLQPDEAERELANLPSVEIDGNPYWRTADIEMACEDAGGIWH